MTTRKWKHWELPNDNSIKLGQMSSSAVDTRLAKGTCACYAETRRNIIGMTLNISGDSISCPSIDDGSWHQFIKVPMGGRITAPGKLYVHILYDSTSELAANNIECMVSVNSSSGYSNQIKNLGNVSTVWTTFTLNFRGNHTIENGDLQIFFRTIGANTITIYSVSAYQPGGTDPLRNYDNNWTDLDDANCVLGDPDYPDDVLGLKLLKDNLVSTRYYKTLRANVFNHWYREYSKSGIAYGANNNDLGRYKFVKRAGISEVKLHFLAGHDNNGGTPKIRGELNGSNNETTLAGAGGAAWYTQTFTFAGADITDELELELLLDGKDADGLDDVYLPGVYLVETAPSASITYTNPNAEDTGPNSDIEAAEIHDNIRTTLNHLWYYGGRQILVSDWRWDTGTTQAFNATATGAVIAGNHGTGGANDCVVARAIAYSSTGMKKIRVRFGYRTSSGSTHEKYIQISHRDDLAIANFDDADPAYDGSVNNFHTVTDAITWDSGSDTDDLAKASDSCQLDVDSGFWEEHYDGVNEPPQVCVVAMTANATEYIVPIYVVAEEVVLPESEFP